MSIWNKVLIGLIAVAVLPFIYLGARTLKTHQYWRELAQAHQKKIKEAKDENQRLLSGVANDPAVMGIEQLRLELHKVLLDRGRVWYDVNPMGPPDPQTGTVRVTIDLPDPHGITDKTVLYVFERGEPSEGKRFLGEFKVAAVAEKEVAIVPSMSLTPLDVDRLQKSRGPWVLYDVLPIDNHAIFAGMSEAELRALLPAGSVPEYLKHGKPAAPNDPKDRVVNGNYRRLLRDYEVQYKAYHLARTMLVDLLQSTANDRQYIEQALADAQKQVEYHQNEIAKFKQELTEEQRRLAAVNDHRQRLEQGLATLQREVDEQLASIQAMAAELARLQRAASQPETPPSSSPSSSEDKVAQATASHG